MTNIKNANYFAQAAEVIALALDRYAVEKPLVDAAEDALETALDMWANEMPPHRGTFTQPKMMHAISIKAADLTDSTAYGRVIRAVCAASNPAEPAAVDAAVESAFFTLAEALYPNRAAELVAA